MKQFHSNLTCQIDPDRSQIIRTSSIFNHTSFVLIDCWQPEHWSFYTIPRRTSVLVEYKKYRRVKAKRNSIVISGRRRSPVPAVSKKCSNIITCAVLYLLQSGVYCIFCQIFLATKMGVIRIILPPPYTTCKHTAIAIAANQVPWQRGDARCIVEV